MCKTWILNPSIIRVKKIELDRVGPDKIVRTWFIKKSYAQSNEFQE